MPVVMVRMLIISCYFPFIIIIIIIIHHHTQPLVRKDVVPLVRSLKQLGIRELAVTTNGVAPWSKYHDLVQAGMTHFNVSLDTLKVEKFATITRRSAHLHGTVLSNIYRLVEAAG